MVTKPDDDGGEDSSRRRPRSKSRTRLSPLLQAASSPPARALYVVLGTVGLAILATAIIGPKRMRYQVVEPLRDAIESHAKKIWAEAAPLREQVAALLDKAGPAERQQLARSFKSWFGRFGAG